MVVAKFKRKGKIRMLVYAFGSALLAVPFFASQAALVPCGGSSQSRCTLCHLIIGIHGVIKYGYRIALTVAIAMITLGGIMYILSRGDSGATTKAKTVVSNALIGIIVIFGAWIIVNTTMLLLSAKPNLGVQKATSWDTFKCSSSEAGTAEKTLPKVATTNSVCVSKTVKSLEIRCEGGASDAISLASRGSVDKPSRYSLKAIAKISCIRSDGIAEEKEEDVTSQAIWSAADETIAKASKGDIQAIGSGDTQVSVSYGEGEGRQFAKLGVYVDSCPLKKTASETGEIFVNNKVAVNPLAVQRVQAADCEVCSGKNKIESEQSCEFVSGNKEAKYAFVVARVNNYNRTAMHPCGDGFKANDQWILSDLQHAEIFHEVVVNMSGDLSYLEDLAQSFAVYRTDKIYECSPSSASLEADCFFDVKKGNSTKRVTGVFIEFSFSRARAFSFGGAAYLCLRDVMDFHKYRIFAHEAIGHAFGGLNDEYEEMERSAVSISGLPAPMFNCSKSSTCSKWRSIEGLSSEGCIKGCMYSNQYYRSSENSIMRDNFAQDAKFSELHRHILKYVIENDGNMPMYLLDGK